MHIKSHIAFCHFLLFFLALVACKKEQSFKGDLAFKLVDIGLISDYSDDGGNSLQEFLEESERSDGRSARESELMNYLELLEEHEIENYKRFFMNIHDDLYTVFVPADEHRQIRDYSLRNLQEKEQKVILEVNGYKIGAKMIKATAVKILQEVDGNTYWQK